MVGANSKYLAFPSRYGRVERTEAPLLTINTSVIKSDQNISLVQEPFWTEAACDLLDDLVPKNYSSRLLCCCFLGFSPLRGAELEQRNGRTTKGGKHFFLGGGVNVP